MDAFTREMSRIDKTSYNEELQEQLKSIIVSEGLDWLPEIIERWTVDGPDENHPDYQAFLEAMKAYGNEDGERAAERLDSLITGGKTLEEVYGRKKGV